MQKNIKDIIIYLAVAFTALFAAYVHFEKRPTLHARHTKMVNFQTLLNFRQQQKDSLLEIHESISSELRYYLRAHRIDDEGYGMIADYNAQNDNIILRLKLMNRISLINRTNLNINIPNIITHRGYWDKRGWHPGIPPLHQGMIISKSGVYRGMIDNHLQPAGHGIFKSPGRGYCEGEWEDGLQHGFGFHVRPYKDIQVGTWVKGRYKGERLHFTSERIYGIDISRYQHEIHGRNFSINWKALRITNLGRHNQQNVTGEANYPVSFIYIKATQGTTVTNQYFAADYKAARQHGYHVGAYHFYSTTSDAQEQAKHFLETASFHRDDFPPVFDVEPSDAQIEAMGGAEKLLSEMRIWLRIVERELGIRPIIYVNQSFVNKYLQDAPDLKRGYLIWIARYSEYKPDIRLCWWQLSATGRVSGITGDVDINVFNGYSDQWEEFLNTGLIP